MGATAAGLLFAILWMLPWGEAKSLEQDRSESSAFETGIETSLSFLLNPKCSP